MTARPLDAARDALVALAGDYVFDGPAGTVRLPDMFEGRRWGGRHHDLHPVARFGIDPGPWSSGPRQSLDEAEHWRRIQTNRKLSY